MGDDVSNLDHELCHQSNRKEEKGSPGSMYNLGLLAAFVQVLCQEEWVN